MIPLFKVNCDTGLSSQYLKTVLESGYLGQGEWCNSLEEQFGARAVLLNSGTAAITLALDLCGVGHGDEVVTTPMTCLATNEPILKLGARPVWADVDPDTGNIDPDDVARMVTPQTKAIIAVDWGGRPCDYKRLAEVADGIPVIGDWAHCVPTRHDECGPECPTFICYSFQAIKFLTCGDGGMLICSAEKTAERARRMRWFGLDRSQGASMRCEQVVEDAGWKFQPNDVMAAIGMANLPLVEGAVNQHIANAWFYNENLRGLNTVTIPVPVQSWYWLYTILVDDPAAFVAWMAERDVACSQVHARNDRQPIFKDSLAPLPGVDAFSARQVSIPVGWWLNSEDRDRVVSLVREWDEIRSDSAV
jgi:dTDP-4-amino-4,6-dideoxygalactose transaminase